MGASFHPSARLCSDYRIGDIAPGAALAVATHLSTCEACAVLTEEPPREAESTWTPSREVHPSLEAMLPPLLREVPRGPWRSLSRGVYVSALAGVSGLGEAVFLLRARPGAAVPLSDHVDILLVLGGSAQLEIGVLSAGDLVELESEMQGTADAEHGLLALVVGDDDLYRGRLGRLLD